MKLSKAFAAVVWVAPTVFLPVTAAQTMEDLQAEIEDLKAENSELMMMLNESVSMEEAEMMTMTSLIENFARQDWGALPQDRTLDKLGNGGRAQSYDVAGFPIYNMYSPEPGFHLSNAGDDSLVRDMQGEVFKFPNTSNLPQDVEFTLPDPPDYNDPSDLIFMPIMEIAALLRSGEVDCLTIVDTFIDRLETFDPYLAIVASPLYEKARETAVSHQALLDNGTDVGPLMCIPFGVKDHHQIGDDDVTSYGHILYYKNKQSTKSTLMAKLMEAGAIPIAKMVLGTYAWGSTHGWGQCMSPYLNGPGGGSSCGSGSGAALGALPFAISEETSGSIASPAYANLISGHIGSYGTISRKGAGLLCSETDHLGFHSRYLSDYGVIMNYARTGADPGDGDAMDIPYINPQDVDLSSLRVMIIDGIGQWVYNATLDEWDWEGDIPQSRSKSGWHWAERAESIKAKLDEAGVAYDTYTLDQAGNLWNFNESTPFFDCASPDIATMMGGGPWAKAQDFEYGFINSKWSGVRNVPKKSYRYMQYCMVSIGKLFLNSDVWATYDVIIDTHTSAGGGYPSPGGSFEQWVRTAKTFVVDYMETLPCVHSSGAATESAMTTLTAKPFEDYKNFAIGALIQDPASLVFPDDDAIMATFGNRTRCALEFFEGFNNLTETCPPMNEDGAPPYPFPANPDNGCDPTEDNHHMNPEWREEPYEPPYMMEDPIPDRALFRWDEYSQAPCMTICPFVQSFCDYKGIVCDGEAIEQEVSVMKSFEGRRRKLTVEDHVRRLERLDRDSNADEH